MSYEQNEQEWIQQFSIEKNIGNLFLVKNHISNTFIIATNFNVKTSTYFGQIFYTTTKEQALKVFAETSELTQSNNKVGVLI